MSEKSFADHFSVAAPQYARFRPGYPPALFEWLKAIAPRRDRAWDCATGSGQAAVALAEHFDRVIATDASQAQLESATPHARVVYSCATAERSGLAGASIELVTVAQALHWFDIDAFYREVNRVVVAGGAIAAWSYGHTEVEPRVDAVIGEFYHDTIGPYWPSERTHVENGYRDLAFPFNAIEAPKFAMRERWTLDSLLGYIGTWSAVQRFRKAKGDAELDAFADRMHAAWGDRSTVREVRWPLMIRAGRVGNAMSERRKRQA
jgi:SAM-dependent methyltransferase